MNSSMLNGPRDENHNKRSKRNPPFRLFDLAPDLRGRIYHELLTWPTNDHCHLSTCHPQILAVSKQVKAEAEAILYKENTEVIQLALRQQSRPLTSCLLSVGGGRALHRELVSTTCLEGCGWPGHLRRMGRLRVVVRMAFATTNAGAMAEMARKVDNILYSLVNFLAGSSGGAQGIEIVLQQEHESGAVAGLNLEGSLLARMLWPLSKCRAHQPPRGVSLVGFAAASSSSSTTAAAAAAAAARLLFEQKITGRPIHNVNLIEKYWDFEQGVKAFFGLSRGDSMAAAVVSQQQQHISMAATRLENMALEEGWVDAVWEEGLISALVVVGTFLKANKSDAMEDRGRGNKNY